jgi:hypothetical protein
MRAYDTICLLCATGHRDQNQDFLDYGERRTCSRRCKQQEQQEAFKGANTSPEVLIELEDLCCELVTLEKQLVKNKGEGTEASK